MSQPTVSVAIAQLEDIVRAQVVVRHQNGETLPPRRGSGPKGRGRGYVLSHATRELDGLGEDGVGALGAVLTLLPAAHEENLPELLSRRVMRCDLFETQLAMLSRGGWLAFLPLSLVQRDITAGLMQTVQLIGGPPPRQRAAPITRLEAFPVRAQVHPFSDPSAKSTPPRSTLQHHFEGAALRVGYASA